MSTTDPDWVLDNHHEAAKEIDRLRQVLKGERKAASEANADYFRLQSENQNLCALLANVKELVEKGDQTTGYCCCGSAMDAHGYGDGHTPVDEGDHRSDQLLAEIKKALEGYNG